MTFGSFWQGIFLIELDRHSGKPLSGMSPRRIAARPNGGTAIEAPFLLHRDGWIYLFVSVDFCCRGAKSTYKTVVGRTRNLDQPFLDRNGKPLLEGGGTVVCQSGPRWRGPGHPGLASDGKHQWIAVHAYDALENGVPTLRIAELRWKRGWPEAPGLTDSVTASTRLEGTWEHRVDSGAASMVVYEAGGMIDNTVPSPGNRRANQGRWEPLATGFKLTWHNNVAAGGAFTDTIRIHRDGLRYEGTNQQGKRIEGRRVQ